MGEIEKLSREQQETLNLYLKEGLNQKEIANRREISHQAVCKTFKKLKEKGLLEGGLLRGLLEGGVAQPEKLNSGGLFRLHNIQMTIRILRKGDFYAKLLGRSNAVEIGGCEVRLYKDTLDLYVLEGVDFRGFSINEAYFQAILFFKRVFCKLENRLHVMIEKDQYLNRKWVRQHLEVVNGALGQDASKNDFKLRFLADDGKTWLLADKSLNGRNHEYTHPISAKQDAEALEPYLDDMRLNSPLTNSQLTSRLNDVAGILEKFNAAFEKLLKVIK